VFAVPNLRDGVLDNLLDYIQAGTVIPVIGSEARYVSEDGRDLPLYRWIRATAGGRTGAAH